MPRLEDLPPEAVADAVAKAVVDAVNQGGDTETIVARALSRVKGDLMLGTSLGQTSANPGNGNPRAGRPVQSSVPVAVASPAPTRTPSANGSRPAPLGSGKAAGGVHGGGRPLLTEGDVLDALGNGQRELRLAPGTLVTALARDAARDAGLRLVEG